MDSYIFLHQKTKNNGTNSSIINNASNSSTGTTQENQMIRTTKILLSRGRYSSMLDMGGVAAASQTSTRLDTGKNNKIRAVALDFDLITKSIEMQRSDMLSRTEKQENNLPTEQETILTRNTVKPKIDAVEHFAKLLGVSLENSHEGKQGKLSKEEEEDDLSLLMHGRRKENITHQGETHGKSVEKNQPSTAASSSVDIRAKYAKKLRQKVEGGLAGVEVAKHKREEMLSRGDAAGHFAARKLAATNSVSASTSGSKWMATTGTGTLLSFLSTRSMKIALLPSPRIVSENEKDEYQRDMNDLTRQLPNVKFHLLVEGVTHAASDENEVSIAKRLLENVTSEIEVDPIFTLVVSDRDGILKAARDSGYFTCRVRRKNAPRGNATTNFTVESVQNVQDVVNELVGISYNTVFSSATT